MQQRSPVQKCAVILGVVLLAAGIAGFFYNGTFTSNEAVHDNMFGAFSVNGWSNTLHVLLGIWGLAAGSSWSGARVYGYGAGLLLIVLGTWGLILGAYHSIISIIPVNTAIVFARLASGVILVLCAVATSDEPAPTTAAPVQG